MTTEEEIRARYEAFMTKVEQLARDMAIEEMICIVAYTDEQGYMHPATVLTETPFARHTARALRVAVAATVAASTEAEPSGSN